MPKCWKPRRRTSWRQGENEENQVQDGSMDQWKNGSMDQGQNQINRPFSNQENQIMDVFPVIIGWLCKFNSNFWMGCVLRFQHPPIVPTKTSNLWNCESCLGRPCTIRQQHWLPSTNMPWNCCDKRSLASTGWRIGSSFLGTRHRPNYIALVHCHCQKTTSIQPSFGSVHPVHPSSMWKCTHFCA